MKAKNHSNAALDSVIIGIKKEDLEATKRSLNELKSQKNAYSCADVDQKRWNMITYKKGKKSSF